MSKFFVNTDAVDNINKTVTITGEDVKHIKNVLRSMPGESLLLSDSTGNDYDVVIEKIEKEMILAKIMGTRLNKSEPPIHITLFQGLPKADKMEYIIQKCVELGVNEIVPVITSRTVVKIDGNKDASAKAARWRRIALEAAKQCDRGIIPNVAEPVRTDEALKLAKDHDLKLLPYEEESEGSFRACLKEQKNIHRKELTNQSGTNDLNDKPGREVSRNKLKVAVFIGPEGGFTPEEVEKAVKTGFKSVTLGPRILRTETAGLAVTAVIMYELGDMG